MKRYEKYVTKYIIVCRLTFGSIMNHTEDVDRDCGPVEVWQCAQACLQRCRGPQDETPYQPVQHGRQRAAHHRGYEPGYY